MGSHNHYLPHYVKHVTSLCQMKLVLGCWALFTRPSGDLQSPILLAQFDEPFEVAAGSLLMLGFWMGPICRSPCLHDLEQFLSNIHFLKITTLQALPAAEYKLDRFHIPSRTVKFRAFRARCLGGPDSWFLLVLQMIWTFEGLAGCWKFNVFYKFLFNKIVYCFYYCLYHSPFVIQDINRPI